MVMEQTETLHNHHCHKFFNFRSISLSVCLINEHDDDDE